MVFFVKFRIISENFLLRFIFLEHSSTDSSLCRDATATMIMISAADEGYT